jgi:hypothetical protein
MQHPKWQQRQANLPLEPEYVRCNAIACIVQVCFGRIASALPTTTKATESLKISIRHGNILRNFIKIKLYNDKATKAA